MTTLPLNLTVTGGVGGTAPLRVVQSEQSADVAEMIPMAEVPSPA